MFDWDRFRPAKKWGIDDDEWECMMLRLAFTWDSYTRQYNQYIVDKVKSNVLAAILPPEKLSKRRSQKRLGRWAHRSGISPDDRRPAYVRSITTYGDVFFEMPGYGYHKVFVDKPGKKLSKTASFVLWWECAEWMERGRHPRCGDITHQNFYNSLACVYSLVEEAKRRGDEVTFLTTPGNVDGFIPAHDEESVRRAPKLAAAYVPPPYPVVESAGLGYKKSRTKMASRSVIRTTEDYTQEKMVTFSEMWLGVEPPGDGLVPMDWKLRAMHNAQNPDSRTHSAREISKYYYWEATTDYDDILNELLDFHYPKHYADNTVTSSGRAITAFDQIITRLPRHKRGTFIMVLSFTPYFLTFWFQYLRWKRISQDFEFFIIDVGQNDWSQTFRREPDFKDNGSPFIHYINISNVFQITVSALGYNGFQELEVDVQHLHNRTEIEINLNSGQKRHTYSSKDYPTLIALEEIIKKDFPELSPARITVPHYPTKNLSEYHTYMSFPDGMVMLNAPDIENFTYKMLKAIGGSVNGVRVV